MPNCDLEKLFGELTASIPDGPPGHPNFVFHTGALPNSPAKLATDRILFRKVNHDYEYHRASQLWMYLSKRKCRELGVFFMACAFHAPEWDVTLEFTRPESAIRRLVIRGTSLDLTNAPVGLSKKPYAFNYFPSETKKHPWCWDLRHDPWDLPILKLSNADECVGPTDEDWNDRDTIWMEPSTDGTFNFAELLLNAGCSWNEVTEYQLEGELGFRGVGPGSAELQIFLPGDFGWMFDDLEDMPAVN